MRAPDGPIKTYMVRFARFLAVAPHRRRRLLEEVEGHLRDATDALVVAGASPVEAENQAIARFGPPEAVAAQFGSSVTGLIYRYVLALVNRNIRKRASTAGAVGPVLISGPSSPCDVCGQDVSADEKSVVDIRSIGEAESPITLVVHPSCRDIAGGILALRGIPVTLAHPPGT